MLILFIQISVEQRNINDSKAKLEVRNKITQKTNEHLVPFRSKPLQASTGHGKIGTRNWNQSTEQ